MPDKVADKVDTVDEVVEKVEEPVVESNTVESNSLNEPNENKEKTPEPVPMKALDSGLWIQRPRSGLSKPRLSEHTTKRPFTKSLMVSRSSL